MGVRQDRKDRRGKNLDPLNYTCGKCKQVHVFNSEQPYICVNDMEEVEDNGAS